jgi:acetyltransferase
MGAARDCFPDYDREVAILAETGSGDERKLLGVGRLLADSDRRTAEYAVLIADDWQDRGLGEQLIDRCLAGAHAWRLESVVAETAADDTRGLAILRERGFRFELCSPKRVLARKELAAGTGPSLG